MSLNDRLRPSQVKPLLHPDRLPVQGEEVFEEGGDLAWSNLLLVPLYFGHHGDGGFLRLLFGQVVAQQRTISNPFPTEIQIKG
ncbi:MAG: hypothetical protein WBK08_01775 [Nitrospira sp.]